MKYNEKRDDILTALVMFLFALLLVITTGCNKEENPPQPIQSHINTYNGTYYNSEYVRTHIQQTWRIYKETHIDTTNVLPPYEYYLPDRKSVV